VTDTPTGHPGDSAEAEGAGYQAGGPTGPRARASRSFAFSILGAAARATGLIVLAVAIGIVLLQYSDDGEERLSGGRAPTGLVPATEIVTSTTSTTAGPRPPAELTVLVLNASGRANQAKPMSDRLGVVGYRTLEPGNATRRPDTAVLCRPGLEREASELVAATGLPAMVEPLSPDEPLEGADEADCVVVIGSR